MYTTLFTISGRDKKNKEKKKENQTNRKSSDKSNLTNV